MPREYIRKSEKNEWLESTLQEVFNALQSGRKVREVGRSLNIPESTLRDKLKANQSNKLRMGRKPVFNEDQENAIANHIIKLANVSYGITPTDLRRLAYRFAEMNKMKHYDFGPNESSDSTAIEIPITLNETEVNIETPVDLIPGSSETNQGLDVPIETLVPVPILKTNQTNKSQKTGEKKSEEIKKEKNGKKKAEKVEKPIVPKKTNLTKKPGMRKLQFDNSESECCGESQLCDDDELNDIDADPSHDLDVCNVCVEFD
ncbi:hypothetical protein HHI36_004385 [Cryptolaemus montrouzieri]|uniref:HTH psq-type domain-containing protein n=1 Tax=Cryptolaemus montrouzieri TaxID=559131 RepID=A0ABD2NR15_9CUCU